MRDEFSVRGKDAEETAFPRATPGAGPSFFAARGMWSSLAWLRPVLVYPHRYRSRATWEHRGLRTICAKHHD